MNLLNRLERKFGRYAIPNLTLIFIVPQVALYIFSVSRPEVLSPFYLIPERVLEGQIWRLITFLAIPPVTNPIFAFFFWYLFWLMGTSLDHFWGTFRYNIYLLIGYVTTVGAAFLVPDGVATNGFLFGSVFLAFAFLNPDFLLYIFFVLPVKIKWLALITWITYGYNLIVGSWMTRVLIIASICNFLIFFANEIRDRIKTGRRHMAGQAARFGAPPKDEPFHRCIICGVTDKTNPDMDFRYCTQCAGTPAYCSEHLPTHQHIAVQ